jgi:hypothetical protein
MDEVFYERLKENEEKVKKIGPHLMGAVNAACNLALYPVFQMSMQLQISKSLTKNCSGKALKDRLFGIIYTPNPANRPFVPPRFFNFSSVFLHNSLQGPLGFYKGYSHAISAFYLNILTRKLITSYNLAEYFGISSLNTVLTGTS